MAEVLISSHAVFLDVSCKGLALQAVVHSRVFPRVPWGRAWGTGSEEETSGGKFKQGVEIIILLATQAAHSRQLWGKRVLGIFFPPY